jgi:hypothetical protein
MATRFFRNSGVDELERLSSESPHDLVLAKRILDELSHRTTSRAQALKRKLETRIKDGPQSKPDAAPKNSAPSVLVPEPAKAGQPKREVETKAENRRTDTQKETAMSAPKIPAAQQTDAASYQAKTTEQASPTASQPASPKPELTPEQKGVTQLIDYVRVLLELSDKPVCKLRQCRHS